MIGYYVHHVGTGHVTRARAVAAATALPVTGLSSLAEPEDWPGEWVVLDRDDSGSPREVDAGGQLHWAPRRHEGLRRRMGRISAWIESTDPTVLIADVSVEVALLARLHGVPVISYVLPGVRTDAAHRLGYGISDALVGCWPDGVRGMTPGLPDELLERLTCVGALSRVPVSVGGPRSPGPPRVCVLLGSGGGRPSPDALESARSQTPEWQWTVLGPGHGWVDDVSEVLRCADVVVTQAGENAVAEVAAARRPAVVVPADRPHEEQRTTADVLARSALPVIVEQEFPLDGWADRLGAARRLDGSTWSRWCDGRAVSRIADVIGRVADGPGR